MRERVVETIRMPIATHRGAVIEVEMVDRAEPWRWRLKLALWLIRIAGKLARLRVRVHRD